MKKDPYLGKWRITEKKQWDQDHIDMETEGYFHFDENGLGNFQFGLVRGEHGKVGLRSPFGRQENNGIDQRSGPWPSFPVEV